MLIKMTNGEMIARANGIAKIQEREEKTGSSILGSNINVVYAISKNKKTILGLLEPYNEALKKLISECMEPGAEANGEFNIKEDKVDKWVKSINELKQIEVDVPVFMISFESIASADLTLSEFEYIDFMVSDPK